MPYSVPPTRNIGDSGHVADHNAMQGATSDLALLQTLVTEGQAPIVISGDTTGATDRAAINTALTTYGIAVLGTGTYWIDTGISMPANSQLRGSGPATVVKLKASAGTLVNVIANSGTSTQYTRISDLTVDGNSTNNASTWQCGIVHNNTGSDGRHMVRNVRIQNMSGDGLVQVGRGSSQYSDIQVFGCNGFGLNVNQDCYYSNIDVGSSGIDGVIEQGSSNQWSACKFWFSGAALVSSRINGATLLTVNAPGNAWDGSGIAGLQFSLANGYGNGFNVANISGAAIGGSGSGGTMAACYFQDNARAGYYSGQASPARALNACVADSNGNNGTTAGVSNGAYAGFDIVPSNTIIEGTSRDRNANVNHQAAALNIVTGANSNSIRLTFSGTLNDGSNMPPLLAGAVVNKSDVSFKAQGRSYFGFTFAANYTPDPFSADIHATTLTGAITIANPALAGTNTTGIFLVPGMRVVLMLTQDGTGGRVVTLGGAYRLNGKAFAAGAGTTTSIEFIYDGTNWQATA